MGKTQMASHDSSYNPTIAQRNRPRRRIRILVFHNFIKAVTRHHHPPITGRIHGLKPQKPHICL